MRDMHLLGAAVGFSLMCFQIYMGEMVWAVVLGVASVLNLGLAALQE